MPEQQLTALFCFSGNMAEPVSLILDFLREHNFEKAEEALRLELQAKHSFARQAYSHDKAELASFTGGVNSHEDSHRNAHSLVDKTTRQEEQLKPESCPPERVGVFETQCNQMNAYTEWEFKSSSNQDCVLEFKKKDARLRMPSPEVSSSNNLGVYQNGMKPMNRVHDEKGRGGRPGHVYRNRELTASCDNGTLDGLASSYVQQCFELTGDHLLCETDQRQQDFDAFDLKSCTFVHEPREVLQKTTYGVKALSPQSNIQNFAISAYNCFSDTSWLDHGVPDDDALTSSKFTQPLLHPLPTGEGFNQQEEKHMAHDCIDFIKALASENQIYPSYLFRDISLPWETGLQNDFVEGELPNERQTQDQYNGPSSNLRPKMGDLSIMRGVSDSFDKLHTNVLFEPSFSLGSFLDIPVGQEIASPGVKQKNGVCQLSYDGNVMQDTPELLSGFATLGDECTDPGMGYSKEYWDSDMYEDDDDPGYERREIEDEDFFLAHEVIYPNEDDKAMMIQEKRGADILSQSNGESETVQGREDSVFFTGKLLCNGGPGVSQTRLDPDISNITALLGNSSTNDTLTLKQIANMSYDGHLMDAEELNLMSVESVWQNNIYQVHYDKQDSGETHDKPCGGYLRERDSRTVSQRKKATQGSDSREDFLNDNSAQTNNAFEEIVYHDKQAMHSVEAVKNPSGIPNHVKVDSMAAGVNEANEYPNFSEDGDASTFSATLDMNSAEDCQLAPTGFLCNVPLSNRDLNAANSDARCASWGMILSIQDSQAEISRPEDSPRLWIKESHKPSQAPTPENEAISDPAFFPHPNVFNYMADNDEPFKPSDGGRGICAYEGSVNEPLADDETSAEQEAQLEKTEEDEYEIFSLRIIHRKNRTGFEEEKHFQIVLNSVVAGRYLVTEYLGSAAFSKAVQARDLQTGMDVCMKIIKNNKDFFDQSLDEIKLLKYVNKNDPADKHHLLRLYDYFYHREHLFIVCELLRANLYEFHKFNRESGGEPYFTMSRLQSITRQCLEALEFLHGLGLIHCDLKPENILIKSYSRCEIKVIDLGSSCFQTDQLCSYVQSRSYRAPEVILGLPYDQKIDIWSLGCILAELCSGSVLFQNDSLATLLARVIGIIEPIMPDMILNGKEGHKYFTRSLMLFERNQDTKKLEYLIPKKSSLRHRLPTGDQGFVDFVGYLLQVNPENRPSASEALKHPWLTHPYEPVC